MSNILCNRFIIFYDYYNKIFSIITFFFFRAMESDDDYYTVSECLSSKVSSYGSCTPVASDQEDEVSEYRMLI